MFELVWIEFRQALSVVDGVTHDDHGGEGEVILFHDLRQVLQFSPVYPLVFPREMVAGGDGGVKNATVLGLASLSAEQPGNAA